MNTTTRSASCRAAPMLCHTTQGVSCNRSRQAPCLPRSKRGSGPPLIETSPSDLEARGCTDGSNLGGESLHFKFSEVAARKREIRYRVRCVFVNVHGTNVCKLDS